MAVTVEGDLPAGVTAKDVILAIIGRIGTGGGIGSVIEYRGSAIRALSMEGRMTVCNMSIEAGAQAGMIAPDDTTFAYLEGRPTPRRARSGSGPSTTGARWPPTRAPLRQGGRPRRRRPRPHVSWGTNPGQVVPIDGEVPGRPTTSPSLRATDAAAGLEYMGLDAGTPMRDIAVDTVFIGSCTNSRIEDLRAAAAVVEGRQVAEGVRTLVVPGIEAVKARPRPRASTGSSRRPASSGGSPGARCAWP